MYRPDDPYHRTRARRRSPTAPLALAALVLAVAVTGCSSEQSDEGGGTGASTSTTTPATGPRESIVFNGQGNHLDAYATEPADDGTFPTQRVFTSAKDDPDGGRDINAQICFLPPTDDGEQWFIAGEDTGQPDRPAGWGIFRLDGDRVGDLRADQIGKLVPTYQPANDNPENYGCGVLPDGRVLTTDVGNQAEGDGDGQLIIWFPPLTGGKYPDFDEVPYCKLDITIPTAQSLLVRGSDTVDVAAARGGVYRYTGPFPTSAEAAGGCGRTDATGAPLADSVQKETVIATGDHAMATPSGLAPARGDGTYVSSVFSGVINEYGPDGAFRRTILQPPAGEVLGERPFSTGTPLGIGVDAEGTLFFADIGIVISADGVGPGRSMGSVRRITIVDGVVGQPQTIAAGLAFPDGIGVWSPTGGTAENPA